MDSWVNYVTDIGNQFFYTMYSSVDYSFYRSRFKDSLH